MATKIENKTYLVERKGKRDLLIEVPANWKVTFGPVLAGARGYQDSYCLRFYETKEKQRAIFTDVVAFRDLSIPVKKKMIQKKSTAESCVDDNKQKHHQESENQVFWEEEVF